MTIALFVLLIAGKAAATTMICKLENARRHGVADMQFIQLNFSERNVRMGTRNYWLPKQPMILKKIASGNQYSWTQVLHNRARAFNLRINDSGKQELYMRGAIGFPVKIDIECRY